MRPSEDIAGSRHGTSACDPTDASGESIREWLQRKARNESLWNFLTAVGALFLSVVVLALTFYFSFFTIFLASIKILAVLELLGYHISLRPQVIGVMTVFFLILLFIGNARTSREYLGDLPRVWWTSNPLSPATANAVGKIITDLLYSGPRLANATVSLFRTSVRLVKLDVGSCARIIGILSSRTGRVSFIEMARLIPGCNPLVVFPQLRDIEGVVFLTKDPAGLSLTADLREELGRLFGHSADPEPSKPGGRSPSTSRPFDRDEYDILGVSSLASLDELKAAYRKKIKICHPDRFAYLGEEMKRLAEEETKALNAAYAAALAGRKNGKSVGFQK